MKIHIEKKVVIQNLYNQIIKKIYLYIISRMPQNVPFRLNFKFRKLEGNVNRKRVQNMIGKKIMLMKLPYP